MGAYESKSKVVPRPGAGENLSDYIKKLLEVKSENQNLLTYLKGLSNIRSQLLVSYGTKEQAENYEPIILEKKNEESDTYETFILKDVYYDMNSEKELEKTPDLEKLIAVVKKVSTDISNTMFLQNFIGTNSAREDEFGYNAFKDFVVSFKIMRNPTNITTYAETPEQFAGRLFIHVIPYLITHEARSALTLGTSFPILFGEYDGEIEEKEWVIKIKPHFISGIPSHGDKEIYVNLKGNPLIIEDGKLVSHLKTKSSISDEYPDSYEKYTEFMLDRFQYFDFADRNYFTSKEFLNTKEGTYGTIMNASSVAASYQPVAFPLEEEDRKKLEKFDEEMEKTERFSTLDTYQSNLRDKTKLLLRIDGIQKTKKEELTEPSPATLTTPEVLTKPEPIKETPVEVSDEPSGSEEKEKEEEEEEEEEEEGEEEEKLPPPPKTEPASEEGVTSLSELSKSIQQGAKKAREYTEFKKRLTKKYTEDPSLTFSFPISETIGPTEVKKVVDEMKEKIELATFEILREELEKADIVNDELKKELEAKTLKIEEIVKITNLEFDDAQKKILEMYEEIEFLKKKKEELETETFELSGKNLELGDLVKEVDKMGNEKIQTLETEKITLEDEIVKLNQKNVDLENENVQLKTKSSSLEQVAKDYETRLTLLEDEKQKLKEEKSNIEVKSNERIDQLEKDLRTLTNEIKTLKERKMETEPEKKKEEEVEKKGERRFPYQRKEMTEEERKKFREKMFEPVKPTQPEDYIWSKEEEEKRKERRESLFQW